VPPATFDAFGWCASACLGWRRPDNVGGVWDTARPVDASNPPGMAFVMHAECNFLPRELARLHAPGLGLENEWALAPYAIDDATDELYARRVAPASLFWLAAADRRGLFWGLHDWCHFHHHGPFVDRAWTELQCDAAALAWLARNADAIGLDAATWGTTRDEARALAERRFADEGIAWAAVGWDARVGKVLAAVLGETAGAGAFSAR
jgi:hypothetical protein